MPSAPARVAEVGAGTGKLTELLVARGLDVDVVEPDPAIKEVRRVLKPGGWLGLIWYVVAKPIEPWEHALADDSDEYDRISKASTVGLNWRLSNFPEAELSFKQVEWQWELTPDGRASFLSTTSMAIAMTPGERAAAFELRPLGRSASSSVKPDPELSPDFRLHSFGQSSTSLAQLLPSCSPVCNVRPGMQCVHVAQPGEKVSNQRITQAKCPPQPFEVIRK